MGDGESIGLGIGWGSVEEQEEQNILSPSEQERRKEKERQLSDLIEVVTFLTRLPNEKKKVFEEIIAFFNMKIAKLKQEVGTWLSYEEVMRLGYTANVNSQEISWESTVTQTVLRSILVEEKRLLQLANDLAGTIPQDSIARQESR